MKERDRISLLDQNSRKIIVCVWTLSDDDSDRKSDFLLLRYSHRVFQKYTIFTDFIPSARLFWYHPLFGDLSKASHGPSFWAATIQ